jgi:hypothetical protein
MRGSGADVKVEPANEVGDTPLRSDREGTSAPAEARPRHFCGRCPTRSPSLEWFFRWGSLHKCRWQQVIRSPIRETFLQNSAQEEV